MCTLLEARQRKALPLMSSHQRCPLFGVVLLHPRVLPAPGAGHRSAQPDGCALLSLSQPKQQLAVNTQALLSPLHSYPSQSASRALQQPCPHIGRGRCYNQKLNVTALVMLVQSGHGSGPTLWDIAAVVSLIHRLVAGRNSACCLAPRGSA